MALQERWVTVNDKRERGGEEGWNRTRKGGSWDTERELPYPGTARLGVGTGRGIVESAQCERVGSVRALYCTVPVPCSVWYCTRGGGATVFPGSFPCSGSRSDSFSSNSDQHCHRSSYHAAIAKWLCSG
eukprot:3445782-Rhodomonas_salina.1